MCRRDWEFKGEGAAGSYNLPRSTGGTAVGDIDEEVVGGEDSERLEVAEGVE